MSAAEGVTSPSRRSSESASSSGSEVQVSNLPVSRINGSETPGTVNRPRDGQAIPMTRLQTESPSGQPLRSTEAASAPGYFPSSSETTNSNRSSPTKIRFGPPAPAPAPAPATISRLRPKPSHPAAATPNKIASSPSRNATTQPIQKTPAGNSGVTLAGNSGITPASLPLHNTANGSANTHVNGSINPVADPDVITNVGAQNHINFMNGQPEPTQEGLHGPDAAGDDEEVRVEALTQLIEAESLREPKLNAWDVAAFIINKVVGTGILVYPPLILQNTQDKNVAIILWWVGFLYTVVSMYIYLRLSKAWFFNGGELIFIDELCRKLRYVPTLLPFIIYGFYFVALSNTGTNGIQFGRQVLIISNPDLARMSKNSSTTLSVPLQTFIAMVVISAFCLINYFSVRAGRRLNKGLALFKIGMLLSLLIKGIIIAVTRGVTRNYEKVMVKQNSPENMNRSSALAFLYVLFAYQGWENASFVLGEVDQYYQLKIGFVIAVVIVGFLYCLISLLFVLTYQSTVNDFESVASFFGNSDAVIRTWAVITAISASGNLISVIYTSARVKLVFAKSLILPWSKLWTRVSESRDTPTGGLILHWIFSCILILAATSAKSRDDQSGLPGNLQTYGHCLIAIPLTIGYIFLNQIVDSGDYIYRCNHVHIERTDTNNPKKRNWLALLLWKPLAILGSLAANFYAVIVYPLPNDTVSIPGNEPIPGWVLLAVNGGVIAFAIIYYTIIRLLWTDGRSFNGLMGEFKESPTVNPTFGKRTELHLENVPGYKGKRFGRFWYWFFSGEKHQDSEHTPWSWLVEKKDEFSDYVLHFLPAQR